MTRWLDDPTAAADDLIESVLDDLGMAAGQRVLITNQHGRLAGQLVTRGIRAVLWNRRIARNGEPATPWPGDEFYDRSLLRLPKSKPEQDMTLHALAARLAPGGRLTIYGGNDEGIKPIAKRLGDLFAYVELRAARGHGRVIEASLLHGHAIIKGTLDQWAQTREIAIGGRRRAWLSYPGLFADGALDDGTALFLAHLPPVAGNAAMLDYGCGTGVLAAAILQATPTARVTLLDNDTLALAAARHNTGTTGAVTGVSLDSCGARRFDFIASNPPLHVGVREDHTALDRLIAGAPAYLTANGTLQMVVQRRIPLERQLGQHFATVSIAAETSHFRIWRATGPKR
jgi:16S rRNA (guanine1207-N2)-methyltransferase